MGVILLFDQYMLVRQQTDIHFMNTRQSKKRTTLALSCNISLIYSFTIYLKIHNFSKQCFLYNNRSLKNIVIPQI